MSTLEEDLGELSDALPLVPGEMTALGGSAQELADAAENLLGEVGAAREEMESLLTHVRNALPDFMVQMEMLEKRLETALAAVEKAWSEADDQLEEGEKTLDTRGQELSAERAELLKALADAGTRVDNASAQGEAAFDRVEAAARDGAARLKAAADAVTAKVAALNALLERTTETLRDSGDAFMDRITRFVDNGHFDADVLLDHLIQRMGEYTSHLEETAKDVETKADGMVLAAAKRATESVRQPLVGAAEDFRVAAERLAATASAEQDSLVKALGAHDEAIGEVKQAAAPLPEGIRQIHEAVARMRQP